MYDDDSFIAINSVGKKNEQKGKVKTAVFIL